MEQEMRIAAEIQQALLPKTQPRRRVLPRGRGVAAVPVDRRRLLRLRRPADAARSASRSATWRARGRPAALLSAMMQGMFAAQAAGGDSPSQTITRVNLALYRRGIESRFVTLMYGSLRAGRPADVLQRRAQSAARRRRKGGASGGSKRRPDRRPVRGRQVRGGDGGPGAGRLARSSSATACRRRCRPTARSTARSGSSTVVQRNARRSRRRRCSRRSSPTCASSRRARRRATTSPRWCCAIGGSHDRPLDRAAAHRRDALASSWRWSCGTAFYDLTRRAGHQGLPVPQRAAAQAGRGPCVVDRIGHGRLAFRPSGSPRSGLGDHARRPASTIRLLSSRQARAPERRAPSEP